MFPALKDNNYQVVFKCFTSFLCVYFACVCLCSSVCSICRGQKRVLDPLELELGGTMGWEVNVDPLEE